MPKPVKPTVPPAALRSNPDTFSANAEATVSFFPTLTSYMDAVGEFTQSEADRATAAAALATGGAGVDLSGQGGRFVRVNSGETGLDFVALSDAAVLALAVPVTDVHSITESGTYSTGSSAANNPPVSGSYAITAMMYQVGGAPRGVVIATWVSLTPRQWIKTCTPSGWQAWREVVTELSTRTQDQWNTGTDATEAVISPAKLAAMLTARLPADLAAMPFGAVGTMALMLRRTTGTLDHGSTVAGADLVFMGFRTSSDPATAGVIAGSSFGATAGGGAPTPSGTWRFLGQADNNDSSYPGGLFVRIA